MACNPLEALNHGAISLDSKTLKICTCARSVFSSDYSEQASVCRFGPTGARLIRVLAQHKRSSYNFGSIAPHKIWPLGLLTLSFIAWLELRLQITKYFNEIATDSVSSRYSVHFGQTTSIDAGAEG